MLRYEMMYGQSLLEKEDFKKPYWYGIDSLSENIQKIEDLLQLLDDNCHNNPTNIINDLQKTMPGDENIYDNKGRLLKECLESLYVDFGPTTINIPNPKGGPNLEIKPLYISNLGYKENKDTYTGKILYDYQIHYEYLINTITDPILEICQELDHSIYDDLITALDNFNDIIQTIEDSMTIVANYITNYLSKYLVNLKSFYFTFFFIAILLMGTTLIILTILFSIYYLKPISALYSSIKSMLYLMNFLMIFCLIFSGITGVF